VGARSGALKGVSGPLEKRGMGGARAEGSERRKSLRVRVQLPCEIAHAGRRVQGVVRDLSAGGLSVQADVAAQEGDALALAIQPKGRDPVAIEALVWHVRRVRQRRTGAESARLGLVLSSAPDAFLALLRPPASGDTAPDEAERPAPSSESAPVSSPESAAAATRADAAKSEPAPDADTAAASRYVVRVRKRASSRTRRILVFADSADEASTSALAETGPDWSVLDVHASESEPARA